jgi:hypothetical protein
MKIYGLRGNYSFCFSSFYTNRCNNLPACVCGTFLNLQGKVTTAKLFSNTLKHWKRGKFRKMKKPTLLNLSGVKLLILFES